MHIFIPTKFQKDQNKTVGKLCLSLIVSEMLKNDEVYKLNMVINNNEIIISCTP